MSGRTTFLSYASEQCPECLQAYPYEIEVRCIECDGPLCPLCVVTVTREPYCVACKEVAHAGARDVES